MPSIRDEHTVSSMTVETNPIERVAPVLQLTTQLIHTYTAINHNYYLKRDGKFPRKKTIVKEDKRQYDYQFHQEEEIFNSQYRVRNRILGMGSFGIVVEGTDINTGQEVAIKIIKKRKGFQEQAQTEIQILQYLHTFPKPGCKYIVQVQNTFIHQGHQCLVFERLGPTLYDLLRKVNFSGLGLKLIRKLTKQIVQALAYMNHPEVNVVHCDLKPENILLVQPTRSQLKIIDFGNACHSNNQMYQYIQSRFYRSPEVILGLQYSSAIDMWSLGCIVAELHTGRPLFGGSDQFDQLRRITNVLGMPPRELIEHANPMYRSKYFDEIVVVEGENRLIDYRMKVRKSPMNADTQQLAAGMSASDTSTTLEALIGVETGGPGGRRLNKANHTVEDYRQFVDLLRRMLDYNPSTRITPSEALSHPFLNTSDPPLEMREKKSKMLRSTQMQDVYSTSTTASSMDIDSLSTSSMYVDSNMDRIKQRRIGH